MKLCSKVNKNSKHDWARLQGPRHVILISFKVPPAGASIGRRRRGDGERHYVAGFELGLQFFGSADESCFSAVEIGDDFAFHQALEGEG